MTKTRPTNRELHWQVIHESCCRYASIERLSDCHEDCMRYVEAYADLEVEREKNFPNGKPLKLSIW